MEYKIECQVLPGGYLPSKKNIDDAGFDLYATEDIKLYPGQVIKHPLNIKLKLPYNTWASITTKSGLGSQGQLVYSGVIDEGYRGIPHIVMTNVKYTKLIGKKENPVMQPNTEPIIIKRGQKIAQMIISPHSYKFYIEKVKEVLADTERGTGGFGSTGA